MSGDGLQGETGDAVTSAVKREADWQMLARSAAGSAELQETETPRELITFLLA